MNIQAPSRRERRARIAQAAKLYGIKGDDALAVHEAYIALSRGEVAEAARRAHPVTQSHPSNPHAWVILGGAALAQREGRTAQAFFGRARELAPRDPSVLEGLAKAHVLSAETPEAVAVAAEAFKAGSRDAGLIGMYMQLMSRLGRRLAAADVVIPVLRQVPDAALSLMLGNMLFEVEEQGRAVEWLTRAWTLDPVPEAHRIARLRGLLYSVRLDEAEALAREMLPEVEDHDAVALILLTALRVQGKRDEALALAGSIEFRTPNGFAQARGIVANIHQDRDEPGEAEMAFAEAIHVAGDTARTGKALGVFLFGQGRYAEGHSYFSLRLTEAQRRTLPLANAEPENLARLDHLWLMSEQGVGDQLALLSLLPLAPLPMGARVTLVGDPRMGPLLDRNLHGLDVVTQASLSGEGQGIAPGAVIYLGDLTRFLSDRRMQGIPTQPLLRANPALRDRMRADYTARAEGRPVVGVAWASRSLKGKLRSIPLETIAAALPDGALVVNLQYGDTAADIEAAQALRPDLEFLTDPSVDQMKDLAGFAAQVAALDRIVTIDNTTAHVAGALGHRGCEVLLPRGAECMWYWGTDGMADPWYGVLHLLRQDAAGDWTAPLAEVARRSAL